MKTFDHEPTISELMDLLEKEYVYIPDFIEYPKIPIMVIFIRKIVKKTLRKMCSDIMLS